MLFSSSEFPCSGKSDGVFDGVFDFVLKLSETAEMTLVLEIHAS